MPSQDWTAERIKAVVTATTSAVARSRFVFLMLNVAVVLSLIALLNAQVPWIRNTEARVTMELKQQCADETSQKSPHCKSLEDTRQNLHRLIWNDLDSLAIPILGVRISSEDLGVIVSPSFLILSIWFWYALRRENHSVLEIRRIANDSDDHELIRYLYHGIAHNFVFTTSSEEDEPEEEKVGEPSAKKPGKFQFARGSIRFLDWTPVGIPLAVVFVDLLGSFMRHGGFIYENDTTWSHLSHGERMEFIGRCGFALGCALCTYFVNLRCQRWIANTKKMMEELDKKQRPNAGAAEPQVQEAQAAE
jgi:hypothetical protein